MNYANMGSQEAILEYVDAIENGLEIKEMKMFYTVAGQTDIYGLDKEIKAHKIDSKNRVEDPGPEKLDKATNTIIKKKSLTYV